MVLVKLQGTDYSSFKLVDFRACKKLKFFSAHESSTISEPNKERNTFEGYIIFTLYNLFKKIRKGPSCCSPVRVYGRVELEGGAGKVNQDWKNHTRQRTGIKTRTELRSCG